MRTPGAERAGIHHRQGGIMRTKPVLTASDVQKMAAACKAEAEKNKWAVTIAIVDDAGSLLYLERMDGAGPMTATVATGKAHTAAITRRPTKFWEDRLKDRPAVLKFPDNLPIQGGVPIMYQGECVGAIGASGVQSHEDEQIANAGIAVLG
jgi:glc operon protein GlcG